MESITGRPVVFNTPSNRYEHAGIQVTPVEHYACSATSRKTTGTASKPVSTADSETQPKLLFQKANDGSRNTN